MDNEQQTQVNEAPAKDAKQGQAPASANSKTNTMAIIAIICAILIPVVGLILGIIALSQIKKNKEGGKGLAIAAVIVSSVFILAYVLVVSLAWGVIFSVDKAAKDAGLNVNNKTGTVTVNKDGNTASYGSNVSLPAGFPSSMPLYSGAKLIAASKTNDSDYSATAVSSDSTSKVSNYYKTELVAKGWTIDSSSDSSSNFGTGTYLNISNGQLQGTVGVTATADKETTISIFVYPKS